MKNILILIATFFLSSCICLLTCRDFNYQIPNDREVVDLSSYWKIKSFNNARIIASIPWYTIYIYGMPSNLIKQGCKDVPDGTWFEINFKNISEKGINYAPETLFDNRKVYVVNNGTKTFLKPYKNNFISEDPGIFGVINYDKNKYPFASDFAFEIPCEVVITPDTIIHIGGIIENGKELPPIEFKVYKKGTYNKDQNS